MTSPVIAVEHELRSRYGSSAPVEEGMPLCQGTKRPGLVTWG